MKYADILIPRLDSGLITNKWANEQNLLFINENGGHLEDSTVYRPLKEIVSRIRISEKPVPWSPVYLCNTRNHGWAEICNHCFAAHKNKRKHSASFHLCMLKYNTLKNGSQWLTCMFFKFMHVSLYAFSLGTIIQTLFIKWIIITITKTFNKEFGGYPLSGNA